MAENSRGQPDFPAQRCDQFRCGFAAIRGVTSLGLVVLVSRLDSVLGFPRLDRVPEIVDARGYRLGCGLTGRYGIALLSAMARFRAEL